MPGTRPIRCPGSIRPSRIFRSTGRERGTESYFVHTAITVVPFITDHLLSPVSTTKQLCWLPFQLVQKPSLLSFQVPSPLVPDLPTGSRVTLPSGVKTILNLTFDGVDAVKGSPVKKVDLISFGAMRPAPRPGVATITIIVSAATNSAPAAPPVLRGIGSSRNYRFWHTRGGATRSCQIARHRGMHLRLLGGAGADAELHAIAVAKAGRPVALVVDAALALHRLMGIAPADMATFGLPDPAHQESRAGQDCGAVGQMHRAQGLAREWASGGCPAQRQADELAPELVHRQGLGCGRGGSADRRDRDEDGDEAWWWCGRHGTGSLTASTAGPGRADGGRP